MCLKHSVQQWHTLETLPSFLIFSFLFPSSPFVTLYLHIHSSAFAYFVTFSLLTFRWSHPAAASGQLGYIAHTLQYSVLKCLDLGQEKV